MSNLLSKSQLQKLRDAAALVSEAASEVIIHVGDPCEIDGVLDYFIGGLAPIISNLDELIGKAGEQ